MAFQMDDPKLIERQTQPRMYNPLIMQGYRDPSLVPNEFTVSRLRSSAWTHALVCHLFKQDTSTPCNTFYYV
jgi:hypothetical protein